MKKRRYREPVFKPRIYFEAYAHKTAYWPKTARKVFVESMLRRQKVALVECIDGVFRITFNNPNLEDIKTETFLSYNKVNEFLKLEFKGCY